VDAGLRRLGEIVSSTRKLPRAPAAA